MNYVPRPGIVRVVICGENVLIPSRSASDYCKTVQRLPLMLAAAWNAFEKGVSFENNVNVLSQIMRSPREKVKENLRISCEELCKKGFMIRVEDVKITKKDGPADSAGVNAADSPSSAENNEAAQDRSDMEEEDGKQ